VNLLSQSFPKFWSTPIKMIISEISPGQKPNTWRQAQVCSRGHQWGSRERIKLRGSTVEVIHWTRIRRAPLAVNQSPYRFSPQTRFFPNFPGRACSGGAKLESEFLRNFVFPENPSPTVLVLAFCILSGPKPQRLQG